MTPYIIEPMRAIFSGKWRRIVLVTGAQSGKTDLILDCIGYRLDQKPAPIIYVGPSREFLTDQFEPRLMMLFDQAPNLSDKLLRGRSMKKTLKRVAGVPVRLAHAGSSTALKSDPAAIAFIDEYDEMMRSVRGQGDALGLVEARGFTYADFCSVVTSTPSIGVVDTDKDADTGLEFWRVSDPIDLESPIWKLWQEGTRFHWAWPCLYCENYFIPRFKQLKWPKDATPLEARKNAWLECPNCGGIHDDGHKAQMNARGVYVAPGQMVVDGRVVGEPPQSSTCSFWVSGIASPFVSFGMRAEDYLKALLSGDQHKMQTAINAGFGECFAEGVGGDAIDWHAVAARKRPYRIGDVPDGVLRVTAGVDVQARCLYYVIRGWGARGKSWLIDLGQLIGPTDKHDVWDQLTDIITRRYGGLNVERVFVDSGFRPGKPGSGDEHSVYEYARQHPWIVYATKGHSSRQSPITPSKIDVTQSGAKAKISLTLLHIDSDFFKSLVHSRLRAEDERPGAFFIPEDTPEDYCRHLVSEWRVVSPDTGRPSWIVRSRENHYLDCEALAAAAAYMLKTHTISDTGDAPRKNDAIVGDADLEASVKSINKRFADQARRLNNAF